MLQIPLKIFSPRQVNCVILQWKDILVKGSAKKKEGKKDLKKGGGEIKGRKKKRKKGEKIIIKMSQLSQVSLPLVC